MILDSMFKNETRVYVWLVRGGEHIVNEGSLESYVRTKSEQNRSGELIH